MHYTASDYDESAHKAMIKLDLADMQLPDDSVDVTLTPHVLEHVPDTTAGRSPSCTGSPPGWSVS